MFLAHTPGCLGRFDVIVRQGRHHEPFLEHEVCLPCPLQKARKCPTVSSRFASVTRRKRRAASSA